jgi:arsenate reductase
VEQEKRKQKVLFLCTQNSARSQMAEGFLRYLAGDHFEAYSAGIDPTPEIHPCAVEAMSEIGIDISGQYPKGLMTYLGKMGFNYLIIVCARAEERCPKTFPGVGATFSWIFDDPRREEDIPYDSMLERFIAEEGAGAITLEVDQQIVESAPTYADPHAGPDEELQRSTREHYGYYSGDQNN